jgi:N-carbamoyl-L-amino-acid hydrolase
MNEVDKIVASVSEGRLWQRVMAMAEHGGTAKGGVNRQAASSEDAASQRQLMLWAAERAFSSFRDEVGNLYIRRDGEDATAAPVLIGSHLDSQPTGGKFDGAYGVLAAFEVLEAISDAGVATRRPIEVVSWMNEEGSRYQPGAMGSGVFAGSYRLDKTLETKDRSGRTLRDELEHVAALAPASFRAMADVRPSAYLEAHIEQGPLLEAAGVPIGIVGGIQGIRRFNVDFTGEEAHAGTTPRRLRKDALIASVDAITTLNHEADLMGEALRFTVGSLVVSPNSPNTVPGAVRFTIDLRHPDDETLSLFEQTIDANIKKVARNHGCNGRVERVSRVLPTKFDLHVLGLLRDSATQLRYQFLELMSGAGHDAMHLTKICPAAMVFVPCLKGISHNEAESANSGDLVAGACVLAAATMQLATASG